MRELSNQVFFIFLTSVVIYLLYLLSPMLTPFLLGALLAYLVNPLVKLLDKHGIPHLLSVILIFLIFILLITLIILTLTPLLQKQIMAFIVVIPQMMNWLQTTLLPRIGDYVQFESMSATLLAALPKTGWLFHLAIKSGHTIIVWIVTLVLTPVVMFYLLRDWDRLLNNIKEVIPSAIRAETVELVKECDEVLSAFFRGQFLVMLALCFIYGVGLTIVGLHVGMVVGLIGGLLSIIPYLGSIFVLVTASMVSLIQFGDWHPLIGVLIVYLIGQAIEGYVLTPYLVGERIGLHPVMVIFSIMAFGTLFGFFGVLVALPVAAVIKVLLCFIQRRYQLQ